MAETTTKKPGRIMVALPVAAEQLLRDLSKETRMTQGALVKRIEGSPEFAKVARALLQEAHTDWKTRADRLFAKGDEPNE